MFPYTQERELSDEDIKDISAYLAGIKLDTKTPTNTYEDALTRLLMAEKVMIIPRSEGVIWPMARRFTRSSVPVADGKTGKGKGMFPMLVGQYTELFLGSGRSICI